MIEIKSSKRKRFMKLPLEKIVKQTVTILFKTCPLVASAKLLYSVPMFAKLLFNSGTTIGSYRYISEKPCYFHRVKSGVFPSYSRCKEKDPFSVFSPKLLLFGTDTRVDASLKNTILTSNSSVSRAFYWVKISIRKRSV